MLTKDVAWMSFWTTFGKSLGFFVPIAIAHFFGVQPGVDSYFFAASVIAFLVSVIGEAPRLVAAPFLAERSGASRHQFMAGLLTATALGGVILTAALVFSAPWLLPRATEFTTEQNRLVVRLLWLGIPAVVLGAWNHDASAYLDILGRYRLAAALAVIRSGTILAAIALLHSSLGIYAIVAGIVAGEAALFIAQMICLSQHTGSPVPLLGRLEPLRAFGRVAGLQISGTALAFAAPVVGNVVASSLGPGSVSVIGYGWTVYLIVFGLLALPLATVLLSRWSNRVAGGTAPGELAVFGTAAATLLVSVPFAATFFVFQEPLTRLLFPQSISLGQAPALAAVCAAYAACSIPLLIHIVFSRYLLAWKDASTMLATSALHLAAYVSAVTVLCGQVGIVAIPLATLAHLLVGDLYMGWVIVRRINRYG